LVQLLLLLCTNSYSLKFVPRALVQSGTIGTIEKLMLIINGYLSNLSLLSQLYNQLLEYVNVQKASNTNDLRVARI
jgi:hypothetical protein